MSIRPETIQFSNYEFSVNEDGTPVKAITLTRSNESDGEISVVLTPSDGTAVAQSDYNNTPITITFAAGETSKIVAIPIVNDTEFEFYETINLNLSNPTGGSILGSQSSSRLIIAPNLTLNGIAKQAIAINNSNPVLRLTDGLGQSGSAFLTNPISLDNNASFSTFFQFKISNPQGISDSDGQGADGLVFVVQTVANNIGGNGGGIGYSGINRSLGVEFDTYNNGAIDHNNGNHVGIDINGDINSVALQPIPARLNDGDVWSAWVDYSGFDSTLEVRLALVNQRPISPLLSYNLDLISVLQTPNAYIGFTSGTGAAGNYHDILNWDFKATYDPIKDAKPGTIQFSNAAYSINENGTPVTVVTLTRTNGSDGEVSATINLSNGTATAPNDYNNSSIVVNFANKEISKTILIPIVDDTKYEPDETINLILASPKGGAILGTQITATLTIVNDDYFPSLGIIATDATKAEGNSGTTYYTFTVNRSGDISGSSIAHWAVSSDHATADDFVGGIWPSGTVTFAADVTNQTIMIEVNGDINIENDESFAISLSDSAGATITTASASGTIINDDPTSLAISPASISLNEGNSGTTVLTYTVTRSGLLTGNSSVDWILRGTGGSPVNASDFVGGVLPSDKLNFKAGETSKTISIRVAGDKIVEPDETFSVTLINPSSNVSITTATASGTIINDDTSLAISPAAISLNEGNSGTTAFTYTVTRSGLLTGNSSVDWSLGTTGSNQVNASDFVGGVLPSDTLNFAAGESSKTFSVQVAGDNIAETDEDFTIKLTNAGSASIATAAATGIILNDDFTSSLINGLGGAAGFGENTLVRSNNGSSQWISLANIFPGGIQIDNSVYYGFYVNNNGNIRFDNPSSDYNPFDIATSSAAIIAPFFADVDTRGGRTVTSPGGNSTGSNSVYWDIDEKNKEITVTWDDVGYYRLRNSPTNAFQVVLKNIGGNALGIDFRYEDVNWLSGDLSGISNARAGYSLGASNRFELPQSGTTSMSMLDNNSNVNVPGLFKFFPTVNQNSIVSLAASPKFVREDSVNNLVYTFTRQGNLANPLYVKFSVAGTASYGSDYSVSGAGPFYYIDNFSANVSQLVGNIRFAANQPTARLVIDPTADGSFEPSETVSISLTSGSGYIIGASSTATATIINDDYLPILYLQYMPEGGIRRDFEGNSGTSWRTFRVTRSGSLSESSSVNYSVQAAPNWQMDLLGGNWTPWGGWWNPWSSRWAGNWGNGLNGEDFTGGSLPSGTVNFAAGQHTADIFIPIQGDRVFE